MRLTIVATLILFIAAAGNTREEYRYEFRKGRSVSINTWTREHKKAGVIELTVTKGMSGEFDAMLCDTDYETREWTYTCKKEGMWLHAVRKNGAILISGTKRGKQLNKTVQLDTASWYQFAEFAFSRMLAQQRDSAVYSIFWPDEFAFYVMKAKKIGDESIDFNGKKIDTVKVKVTLTGFRSIFWSSYYWFRKPDFLFVRYVGVNGLPGTDATIIELMPRDGEHSL